MTSFRLIRLSSSNLITSSRNFLTSSLSERALPHGLLESQQYSAPAYETEKLPPSSAASNGEQGQVIEGKVAHLPYSFVINLGGKGAGTLEVNILTADGEPLRGYPKTVANAFGQAAEATSQEFEIPVTPKLSAKIEKGLLEKNQHLTQVQLVVQTSQ